MPNVHVSKFFGSTSEFHSESLITLYRPAMPFGNRKKYIFGDLFSAVLSQFKKYHPSGNLKCNNLGILKSLKLCILVKKSFQFILS